ncbi:hypothetical protein [Acetomicrobium sp.]|uniref:hypothetical protein n=1 Tax=Acetomicrobium sp. TaxID=1872099 RepID=UPI002FC62A68
MSSPRLLPVMEPERRASLLQPQLEALARLAVGQGLLALHFAICSECFEGSAASLELGQCLRLGFVLVHPGLKSRLLAPWP